MQTNALLYIFSLALNICKSELHAGVRSHSGQAEFFDDGQFAVVVVCD